MVRGGAEYQVQEAMNHAVINWSKTFLHDTNAGLRSICQAASTGVQGDLMSSKRWGEGACSNCRKTTIGANRRPRLGDENWSKESPGIISGHLGESEIISDLGGPRNHLGPSRRTSKSSRAISEHLEIISYSQRQSKGDG